MDLLELPKLSEAHFESGILLSIFKNMRELHHRMRKVNSFTTDAKNFIPKVRTFKKVKKDARRRGMARGRGRMAKRRRNGRGINKKR